MRFEIANTHAYPGCKVQIVDEGNTGEIVAQFSDGTITQASYSLNGTSIRLTIHPYTTARGTDIGLKSWRLSADSSSRGWKVKAQLWDDDNT